MRARPAAGQVDKQPENRYNGDVWRRDVFGRRANAI